MKYLKYLFSSMLIAGALALAGCGSDGDTRADGDRNVIKEEVLDREINVDGVIRGHKTGAPLDNILVTLIQGGKVKEAKTVDLNGHYSFQKVKVASDQGAESDADNSANAIQLEFKEIKTKKLNGDGDLVSGSDLYPNGTTTPSYPESRISFVLVSSDLEGPELNAADDAAADIADGSDFEPSDSVSLVDAINEGRSYYFVDANTVRIRDVRLVQKGTLTGVTVDSDTGLPVAGAYVTISTDNYFRSPNTDADDIVAVWQQTRIRASLSDVNGEFTFDEIPALDYYTSYSSSDLHVECQGYLENTTSGFNDHANIRDDLNGSVGVILLSPIVVTYKTVTMTFVDQNLTPLPDVTVTFTYNATSTNSAYTTALGNGIATETRWVLTSDEDGVATDLIPALRYDDTTAHDFTAKLSGYKLDDTFTQVVVDEDDLKLDLLNNGGVDKALDLGIIKMIPDTKKFASTFKVQLIYDEAPIEGAAVTGYVKYIDTDVSSTVKVTLLIEGDDVSDNNGFVTFNTTKIPASAAGLSVEFIFDVDLTGATSVVSALDGTYVVQDGDNLDLREDSYTDGSVTTLAANSIHQIVIKDKLLKLAGLEGYIVSGDNSAPTSNGDVSFEPLADINLKLNVKSIAPATTTSYFTTTDANGYYAFLATDGVEIPLTDSTNNLKLELVVLGDFVFSDGGDDTIDLEDDVGADNGVDQIDTQGGFPGGTAWLWQLDETGDELGTKYDGKTLQVHTAAVQPEAAVETGYHVVSLVKTVAGVSTLSVIETEGARLVYTYTQAQDDATGIQVIMSGAVDSTLPFEYNGLTGANLTPDNKTVNRLQIINFDLVSNTNPDGEVLTFTATASGRTITIVPSGNANKFQTQVSYQLKVRVVSTDGQVSDDTLYFRFYDAATEIFSTEKPSIDVSTMTLGDYWYLRNNVAAEADNYKLAINDADGVFAVGEVHFLVYKEPTGFGFATGGIQNRAFDINAIKLVFPVPTDLRTGATADTNVASVVTDLADFEVWAQAYTVGGVILQHWTNVSTGANASVGNIFDAAFAGKMKIGLSIFGNSAPNIFEQALAEGNKVDLTVVHKDSQIDPSASKCLTLSLADHAGVQAKSVTIAAATYVVTLSENVNAVATTTPTMTTSSHGVVLSNVRYTAANEITADSTLTITSATATDVNTSPTSSIGTVSANWVGDIGGGDSALVLGTSTASVAATMATIGNELRLNRRLQFDADGAAVATASVNGVISKHSSLSFATIPIITGTGVGGKDWTYNGALDVIADTVGDASTATRVDIDIAPANLPMLVTGLMTGRQYNIGYTAVTAGSALRTVLENIVVGDVLSVSGSNFYLVVTAHVGTDITVVEDGLSTANVRSPLGYDATTSSGANLILAPQIRFTAAGAGNESDDSASGIAEVISTGSDATTGVNRGAADNDYTIITSTMVLVTGLIDLYPGESIVLLTDSATATDGNEPVYSATVLGAKKGTANTVVTLISTSVTQIRGTTETFGAGGQTAHTNGFITFGDSVTVGLGTGIVSVMSGAAFNTNGDAVSNSAFTDDTHVQQNNGEGFNGVK